MNNKDLEKLRHSTEHILTQAMLKLYPGLKMAMGPAIEDGFYFDFESKKKISEEDFPQIEAEMAKIIKKDLPFKKKILSVSEARKLFKGNPYKQEWLDEIKKKKEKATVYWTGDEFVDLCSGPHVKSTGEIKAFKLLSVAGAYWRGDEKNKMLSRIYGTAFKSQKELDEYLKKRQLAEESNHRVLGKKLGLFEIFPEIGQGLPVWLPKGYTARRAIEDYMLELERQYDYEHLLTPHISRKILFETSGHLDFYRESMYSGMKIDDEEYFLKPMNCPAAMVVYKSRKRSYRDLPLKWGELGTVYRYEKSGELHGLQRVRGFTQNDAHIFCTKEQLVGQIEEVLAMMKIFYNAVGFDDYRFVLATGDPQDKKFKACGTSQTWRWAEETLRKVLKKNKLPFEELKGDAAFYGPKIDVLAVNVFGKTDAVSTIQIDFNLPSRFGLKYINSQAKESEPVVVHRALVGSFERFFAFLIEHHQGAFPVWFAPVQARILPISKKHLAYAQKIHHQFKEENLRVEIDARDETLPAKIREAQLQKIPYMLIVGDKEVKAKKVAVRLRDAKDLGQMGLEKFKKLVKKKIETRALNLI